MQFEELSQYVIPLLFLLYFFTGKKKKKPPAQTERPREPEAEKSPWVQAEERSSPPPRSPQMEARSLPPIQRKLSKLESAIATRHLPDRIEKRHYTSSISDERAQSLVSAELSEHIGIDQAYALKPRHQTSYGRAILNQLSSPKEAFILQVIINRYEHE